MRYKRRWHSTVLCKCVCTKAKIKYYCIKCLDANSKQGSYEAESIYLKSDLDVFYFNDASLDIDLYILMSQVLFQSVKHSWTLTSTISCTSCSGHSLINICSLVAFHGVFLVNKRFSIEAEDLRFLSDIDDLSTTFWKLNKAVSEPKSAYSSVIRDQEKLITHGDNLLSLASATFGDSGVTIHGKISLMHSWYRTRSHPSELTAGFYNTASRDGYEPVAEMFARNSCKMILPGMDLSDANQPKENHSSPELLLAQIMAACKKHGVRVSG
ncbi:hypothetical protein Fmac_008538 [Flemingia macrophylla]|uniref:Beta-amylase n=1 Tax=Flemingia macrophylla TaxID=520843 RepID=A0ABD1MXR8_9FABA